MNKDKSKSSTGKDLIRTVTTEHLSDSVFDVAEALIDQKLENSVFQELPIINIFASIARAKQSVSEQLFVSKVNTFFKRFK